MSIKNHPWILSGLISILLLVINFLIFSFSYNSLTRSLLTEDQRIENAGFIMGTTLPLFAFVSFSLWLIMGFLLSRNAKG
ncbi:hypothetical protein ACJJIU_02315 [Microbulbifer sp. CnH-101-E]|uniref:hypothetical protein n=1 Tax=unclassified Microbulbifer TaxID=2619833 RepID=UPI0040396578